MSRSDAKERITLSEFKKSMEGIYSSTINRSTIDESPFAYKPMDEIISNIGDTVEIVKIIHPIYNFKAAV
jgi:RNA-splicing ligase RtcB